MSHAPNGERRPAGAPAGDRAGVAATGVAAIVLAAGAARRYGGAKTLEPLAGRPVVRWVVDAARGAGLSPIVVVARRDGAGLREALAGARARLVRTAGADAGLGASIGAGLAALAAPGEHGTAPAAAVLLHGDQPFVRPALLSRLVERWGCGDCDAVAPSYRGLIAPPVLVARALWSAFMALEGDRGGKELLRRAERVAHLDLDEDAPLDIDTRADLERARALLGNLL